MKQIQGRHFRKGKGHDLCTYRVFKDRKVAFVRQKMKAIQEYIHFDNHSRFQKKLNNLSPIEYREKAAA